MPKTKTTVPVDFDVDEMLDQCNAISNAVLEGKDGDEVESLAIAMPLFPRAAKGLVMVMGKERFLKMGYDRTRADAAYGMDWIDKADAERRELTGTTRLMEMLD